MRSWSVGEIKRASNAKESPTQRINGEGKKKEVPGSMASPWREEELCGCNTHVTPLRELLSILFIRMRIFFASAEKPSVYP
jgi:hypothetical protein